MKELREGMTVDELLGELRIVCNGSIAMILEFPGFDGETMYTEETVNFRELYIASDETERDMDENAKS